MSKLKFTNHFKHKFAQGLENYFIENKVNLGVETEYRTKVGEEENRIDVAIVNLRRYPINSSIVIGNLMPGCLL